MELQTKLGHLLPNAGL